MAAKKMKRIVRRLPKAGSKTAFVLGLPVGMSAKDVVAQAKEKGLKLSPAYVYKIRGRREPARAAKARGHRRAGSINKTDFVRSLPPDVSYAEAAEKAKAAGLEVSQGHFYVIKSEIKKQQGARGSRVGAGRNVRAVPRGLNGLRLTSGNPSEQAFLESLRTLGAARARGLIAVFERFQAGRR